MREIEFAYGPMNSCLETQANRQGYTLGSSQEQLEKIRYAINMCMFHVATYSQVKMMTTKLNKKVVNSLKSLNESENK